MPKIYMIAGCNGAGKTTASYTMLPEMLDCKEFVNADSIAAGITGKRFIRSRTGDVATNWATPQK